jgi:hypothetical protein
MSWRKKIGWDELEREAKIKRTERASFTTDDARRLERNILGRTWGKRRASGSPPK